MLEQNIFAETKDRVLLWVSYWLMPVCLRTRKFLGFLIRPEMRGGTANCSVVVSDEPVASPIVTQATNVVAMNRPPLRSSKAHYCPAAICL